MGGRRNQLVTRRIPEGAARHPKKGCLLREGRKKGQEGWREAPGRDTAFGEAARTYKPAYTAPGKIGRGSL